MKIVFQNVIVLLSFAAYSHFGLAKDSIKIGAFFDNGQSLDRVNWEVVQDNIQEEIELQDLDTRILTESDSFQTKRLFCNAVADNPGYSAVFGPRDPTNSAVIETISSFLQIPLILTHWTPVSPKKYTSTFNLYPDAKLLSQGLKEIVKSLDWETGVVLLYENDDSLSKIQDVLKIDEYGTKKKDVILKRLGPGPDYRAVLKEVSNSSRTRRIILDCDVEKIPLIMGQAKEQKLLDDLSTSFFLSSLDAHTLDLNSFNATANITTIRLFNPYDERVQSIVSRYFPETLSEKLRVESALLYDALLLLAKSIGALQEDFPDRNLSSVPKFCDSKEEYQDELELIKQMSEVKIEKGITGDFQLESGTREQFKLEVIDITKPQNPIGIWDSETEQIILTRNATERDLELQRRISSHNFIVSSKLGVPYLMQYEDQAERLGNNKYYGYSMDLIKEISAKMNFSFHFEIKESTKDIISDLVNRKADLGICDFTITDERSEQIDFSLPFMQLGISILHKYAEQEEIDNMYGFMRPFLWTVWIYIITLYLVMSLVLILISRLDPDDWENPHPCNQEPEELENIWGLKNCLWLTMGSIMTQGCDILPKGISSRMATAMWWFFSLIMTSTYTANLAAFLTMQKQDDGIKSVEELANQNKVKYGLVTEGSTEMFFKTSNVSTYQKMWATMVNENPSVFEKTNEKGEERVNSTKQALYAFFMESPTIEYMKARNCKLTTIGNKWLDSKGYGIGMPLGAEYRGQINAALLNLEETGKLSELKKQWWEDKNKTCDDQVVVITEELGLTNCGGVFIVLAAGLALAFLFAIIEFLWNVRDISVEEHMTYLEALKCEVKFACNITVTKKAAKPIISESSSQKSDDENSMARTILAGAGSVLNINASVLNRLGYHINTNDHEM